MEERAQKLKYISEYFGVQMQESKMQEEAGELITAISRYQQGTRSMMLSEELQEAYRKGEEQLLKAITTELADVYILLEQLIELYDNREEFEQEVEYKIERTLKRIAYGYYE